MEKRNFIIPEFGPLAGLRVIGAGSLIAMPFAATMMADFGAEVRASLAASKSPFSSSGISATTDAFDSIGAESADGNDTEIGRAHV